MSTVIVCAGLVGVLMNGSRQDNPTGQYLESFDPDYNDGAGLASWTTDPDKAMTFLSAQHAFNCWRSQSSIKPLRNDGLPNMPLTAYTVQIREM